MFHFSVDERNAIVRIHAFINTHKSPDDYWLSENS